MGGCHVLSLYTETRQNPIKQNPRKNKGQFFLPVQAVLARTWPIPVFFGFFKFFSYFLFGNCCSQIYRCSVKRSVLICLNFTRSLNRVDNAICCCFQLKLLVGKRFLMIFLFLFSKSSFYFLYFTFFLYFLLFMLVRCKAKNLSILLVIFFIGIFSDNKIEKFVTSLHFNPT